MKMVMNCLNKDTIATQIDCWVVARTGYRRGLEYLPRIVA
jgi:hypothetical protein